MRDLRSVLGRFRAGGTSGTSNIQEAKTIAAYSRAVLMRNKRERGKKERERERRETERARERVSKGGRQERREMVNQPSSADHCHSLRLLLRLEQGFVIVIEQHTPESLAYPNSVQAEDCTFGYKIEKWSLLAPCVAVLVLQAAVPL